MDGHSWAHVLLAYLLRLVWLSEFRQLTSKPFSIRVSDFIFEYEIKYSAGAVLLQNTYFTYLYK